MKLQTTLAIVAAILFIFAKENDAVSPLVISVISPPVVVVSPDQVINLVSVLQSVNLLDLINQGSNGIIRDSIYPSLMPSAPPSVIVSTTMATMPYTIPATYPTPTNMAYTTVPPAYPAPTTMAYAPIAATTTAPTMAYLAPAPSL